MLEIYEKDISAIDEKAFSCYNGSITLRKGALMPDSEHGLTMGIFAYVGAGRGTLRFNR